LFFQGEFYGKKRNTRLLAGADPGRAAAAAASLCGRRAAGFRKPRQAPRPAFIPPEALPNNVLLDGFRMVWQQVNRCAAAALTIQLYYYEWDGTYQDVINYLNPHMDDVSVRPDEKASFVEQHGLRSVWRVGGDEEPAQAAGR
jgi:hypothetical protein